MIGLDWRNLFEEVILERAIGICLEHKVQNIQTEPFHIRADVFGTEKYHVEIKYGDMFSMTCTCPYARKEKNCKHMAAVCLIAKTKLSIDINALTNRDHDIIHTFLNHINEQEAKALIQRLMDKYPYIARKIYQEEIKTYNHKKRYKEIP